MIEGTALIKFTKNEVQLLINSLHMSITTVVPCVEGSEWKKPYKNLKKDLKKIRDAANDQNQTEENKNNPSSYKESIKR